MLPQASKSIIFPHGLALLSALTISSEGVLSDPSGLVVVKPCKKEEITFYESTASHPEFTAYIPSFFGTLALAEPSQALPPAALIVPDTLNHQALGQPHVVDAVAVEKAWAPSNGGKITTDSAIVLENVAARFKKPNILDVKLGARLWANDAPKAKREKLDKVAAETTSRSLGLRIAGMRTWQGPDAIGQKGVTLDGYRIYDKEYGKKFKSDNVRQGFEEYFCLGRARYTNRSIRKVIRRFVEDLKGMLDVLEREESRMYSASLLFVYEGNDLALDEGFLKEKEILASIEISSMVIQNFTNGESSTNSEGTINGKNATNEQSVPSHENGIPHTNGTPPRNGTPSDEALTSIFPLNRTVAVAEDDDDGDDESPFPPIQALKLIDFAHAEWTPGKGPDNNLLHGIRNVIEILDNIQSHI